MQPARSARSAKVEGGFLNGFYARHFAKQRGRLVLIRRESRSDSAVAHDAFIGAVLGNDLPNVLRDQVCAQAKTSHVGERPRENSHSFKARKFIDQQKEPMLVIFLLCSVKRESLGQTVDDHGKDEASERPNPIHFRRWYYQVKGNRLYIIDQV